MAHLFRTPNKDAILRRGASVAGTSSAQNFGGDEILEVGKLYYGSSEVVSAKDIARALIKFETGSLNPLTSTNITIYPKNLQSEYKETSKARIRIVGRERYPQRTFSDSSLITDIKYLPQTTYYQIRDVETNLVILPFDTNHTKVSCDSTGNYFDIERNFFIFR